MLKVIYHLKFSNDLSIFCSIDNTLVYPTIMSFYLTKSKPPVQTDGLLFIYNFFY
ncbi:hypothetical protein KSE1242_22380 [Staphylococcus epidermidis]